MPTHTRLSQMRKYKGVGLAILQMYEYNTAMTVAIGARSVVYSHVAYI